MTNTPSIEILADRISQRLEALGLTERQASLRATGRPDAIRYIRTRRAMPSWERLLKIAEVIEADPAYLYGYTETNVWNESVRDALDLAKNMTGEAMAQFGQAEKAEDTVPCLKSVPGPSREFVNANDLSTLSVATTLTSPPVIHTLAVPEPLRGRVMAGYQVVGRGMEPLYDDQSLVLMDADTKVRLNDSVIVDLGPHEEVGHVSVVGVLIGRTKTGITLRQFNPPREFQIGLSKIGALYRIIPYSELITF